MQETNQEVIAVIIVVVVLLSLIGLVVLLLAVYYGNTKKRLITEKEILKALYEQSILQAQLEIQEQTLKNVSQEIHDNIGQVLSYVSMSLDRAVTLENDEKNSLITESRSLVNQSMGDLRDLSKSFSLDNITANGLIVTIKAEVARLNKSRLITAELDIAGETYSMGEHKELVLFRILQEFINNTLKHARAKNLTIALNYSADNLAVKIADNGVGYVPGNEQGKNGSGLKNMRTRAALIGAELISKTEMGEGTGISILLKK